MFKQVKKPSCFWGITSSEMLTMSKMDLKGQKKKYRQGFSIEKWYSLFETEHRTRNASKWTHNIALYPQVARDQNWIRLLICLHLVCQTLGPSTLNDYVLSGEILSQSYHVPPIETGTFCMQSRDSTLDSTTQQDDHLRLGVLWIFYFCSIIPVLWFLYCGVIYSPWWQEIPIIFQDTLCNYFIINFHFIRVIWS